MKIGDVSFVKKTIKHLDSARLRHKDAKTIVFFLNTQFVSNSTKRRF